MALDDEVQNFVGEINRELSTRTPDTPESILGQAGRLAEIPFRVPEPIQPIQAAPASQQEQEEQLPDWNSEVSKFASSLGPGSSRQDYVNRAIEYGTQAYKGDRQYGLDFAKDVELLHMSRQEFHGQISKEWYDTIEKVKKDPKAQARYLEHLARVREENELRVPGVSSWEYVRDKRHAIEELSAWKQFTKDAVLGPLGTYGKVESLVRGSTSVAATPVKLADKARDAAGAALHRLGVSDDGSLDIFSDRFENAIANAEFWTRRNAVLGGSDLYDMREDDSFFKKYVIKKGVSGALENAPQMIVAMALPGAQGAYAAKAATLAGKVGQAFVNPRTLMLAAQQYPEVHDSIVNRGWSPDAAAALALPTALLSGKVEDMALSVFGKWLGVREAQGAVQGVLERSMLRAAQTAEGFFERRGVGLVASWATEVGEEAVQGLVEGTAEWYAGKVVDSPISYKSVLVNAKNQALQAMYTMPWTMLGGKAMTTVTSSIKSAAGVDERFTELADRTPGELFATIANKQNQRYLSTLEGKDAFVKLKKSTDNPDVELLADLVINDKTGELRSALMELAELNQQSEMFRGYVKANQFTRLKERAVELDQVQEGLGAKLGKFVNDALIKMQTDGTLDPGLDVDSEFVQALLNIEPIRLSKLLEKANASKDPLGILKAFLRMPGMEAAIPALDKIEKVKDRVTREKMIVLLASGALTGPDVFGMSEDDMKEVTRSSLSRGINRAEFIKTEFDPETGQPIETLDVAKVEQALKARETAEPMPNIEEELSADQLGGLGDDRVALLNVIFSSPFSLAGEAMSWIEGFKDAESDERRAVLDERLRARILELAGKEIAVEEPVAEEEPAVEEPVAEEEPIEEDVRKWQAEMDALKDEREKRRRNRKKIVQMTLDFRNKFLPTNDSLDDSRFHAVNRFDLIELREAEGENNASLFSQALETLKKRMNRWKNLTEETKNHRAGILPEDAEEDIVEAEEIAEDLVEEVVQEPVQEPVQEVVQEPAVEEPVVEEPAVEEPTLVQRLSALPETPDQSWVDWKSEFDALPGEEKKTLLREASAQGTMSRYVDVAEQVPKLQAAETADETGLVETEVLSEIVYVGPNGEKVSKRSPFLKEGGLHGTEEAKAELFGQGYVRVLPGTPLTFEVRNIPNRKQIGTIQSLMDVNYVSETTVDVVGADGKMISVLKGTGEDFDGNKLRDKISAALKSAETPAPTPEEPTAPRDISKAAEELVGELKERRVGAIPAWLKNAKEATPEFVENLEALRDKYETKADATENGDVEERYREALDFIDNFVSENDLGEPQRGVTAEESYKEEMDRFKVVRKTDRTFTKTVEAVVENPTPEKLEILTRKLETAEKTWRSSPLFSLDYNRSKDRQRVLEPAIELVKQKLGLGESRAPLTADEKKTALALVSVLSSENLGEDLKKGLEEIIEGAKEDVADALEHSKELEADRAGMDLEIEELKSKKSEAKKSGDSVAAKAADRELAKVRRLRKKVEANIEYTASRVKEMSEVTEVSEDQDYLTDMVEFKGVVVELRDLERFARKNFDALLDAASEVKEVRALVMTTNVYVMTPSEKIRFEARVSEKLASVFEENEVSNAFPVGRMSLGTVSDTLKSLGIDTTTFDELADVLSGTNIGIEFTDRAFVFPKAGGSSGVASGYFSPITGDLVLVRSLSLKDPKYVSHVLEHELVHAILDDFEALPDSQRTTLESQTRAEMKKAEAEMTDEEMGEFRYAFTHPREFIAEAWSNKDFQTVLGRIKSDKAPTIWERLKRLIGDILKAAGVSNPDSVLARTLSVSSDFMSRAKRYGGSRGALGSQYRAMESQATDNEVSTDPTSLKPTGEKAVPVTESVADTTALYEASLATWDELPKDQRTEANWKTAMSEGFGLPEAAVNRLWSVVNNFKEVDARPETPSDTLIRLLHWRLAPLEKTTTKKASKALKAQGDARTRAVKKAAEIAVKEAKGNFYDAITDEYEKKTGEPLTPDKAAPRSIREVVRRVVNESKKIGAAEQKEKGAEGSVELAAKMTFKNMHDLLKNDQGYYDTLRTLAAELAKLDAELKALPDDKVDGHLSKHLKRLLGNESYLYLRRSTRFRPKSTFDALNRELKNEIERQTNHEFERLFGEGGSLQKRLDAGRVDASEKQAVRDMIASAEAVSGLSADALAKLVEGGRELARRVDRRLTEITRENVSADARFTVDLVDSIRANSIYKQVAEEGSADAELNHLVTLWRAGASDDLILRSIGADALADLLADAHSAQGADEIGMRQEYERAMAELEFTPEQAEAMHVDESSYNFGEVDWKNRTHKTKFNLSGWQRVALYAYNQDPHAREKIINNGFLPAHIRKKVDPIPGYLMADVIEEEMKRDPERFKKELALATRMIKIGSAYAKTKGNLASQAIGGLDKFSETDFFTLMGASIGSGKLDKKAEDMVSELLGETGKEGEVKDSGVAKERVAHNNPISIQDGDALFRHWIRTMSVYANWARPYQTANRALNGFDKTSTTEGTIRAHRKLDNFMLTMLGKRRQKKLWENVKVLTFQERLTPQGGPLQLIANVLQSRQLALSWTSWANNRYGGAMAYYNQLMAEGKGDVAVEYLKTVVPDENIRTVGMLSASDRAIMDLIEEHSPYTVDRWERSPFHVAAGHFGKYDIQDWDTIRTNSFVSRLVKKKDSAMKAVNKYAYAPMVAGEQKNAVDLFRALKKKSGISDLEAAKEVERLTRRTQNPSDPIDAPEIYLWTQKHPGLRLFIPFIGQPAITKQNWMRNQLEARRYKEKADRTDDPKEKDRLLRLAGDRKLYGTIGWFMQSIISMIVLSLAGVLRDGFDRKTKDRKALAMKEKFMKKWFGTRKNIPNSAFYAVNNLMDDLMPGTGNLEDVASAVWDVASTGSMRELGDSLTPSLPASALLKLGKLIQVPAKAINPKKRTTGRDWYDFVSKPLQVIAPTKGIFQGLEFGIGGWQLLEEASESMGDKLDDEEWDL